MSEQFWEIEECRSCTYLEKELEKAEAKIEEFSMAQAELDVVAGKLSAQIDRSLLLETEIKHLMQLNKAKEQRCKEFKRKNRELAAENTRLRLEVSGDHN